MTTEKHLTEEGSELDEKIKENLYVDNILMDAETQWKHCLQED